VIFTAAFVSSSSRLLAMLGSAPFGFELSFLSRWIDIQVEPAPSDRLFEGIFLSKNVVDDLVLSTRHRIYEIPRAIFETGDWINKRMIAAARCSSDALKSGPG
jgi:hypothetical protein